MNTRTFPPVLLVMIGDGQHRASCDIMELTGLRVLSTSVQQAFCRKVFHSLYPSFFFVSDHDATRFSISLVKEYSAEAYSCKSLLYL